MLAGQGLMEFHQ